MASMRQGQFPDLAEGSPGNWSSKSNSPRSSYGIPSACSVYSGSDQGRSCPSSPEKRPDSSPEPAGVVCTNCSHSLVNSVSAAGKASPPVHKATAATPPAGTAKDEEEEEEPKKLKRPMSAFLIWARTERRRLHNIVPQKMPNSEISKLLGQKWRIMPEALKAPYHEQAAKACDEYREANPKRRRRQPRAQGAVPLKATTKSSITEDTMVRLMQFDEAPKETASIAPAPNGTLPLAAVSTQDSMACSSHYDYSPTSTCTGLSLYSSTSRTYCRSTSSDDSLHDHLLQLEVDAADVARMQLPMEAAWSPQLTAQFPYMADIAAYNTALQVSTAPPTPSISGAFSSTAPPAMASSSAAFLPGMIQRMLPATPLSAGPNHPVFLADEPPVHANSHLSGSPVDPSSCVHVHVHVPDVVSSAQLMPPQNVAIASSTREGSAMSRPGKAQQSTAPSSQHPMKPVNSMPPAVSPPVSLSAGNISSHGLQQNGSMPVGALLQQNGTYAPSLQFPSWFGDLL
ncbi:transcription factor Sox-7-like [Sycon ciliatum]|uniref:transcription factor Sox-7-like n=1 Tax=Sycon ciliatum TaxID=27933 RepID=UPI0031F695D6